MPSLKDKLQNSLDESRMLILGTQVLLGFHYRAVFESGFDKLPAQVQPFEIPGLVLLILALALLVSPVAFHHIVLHGESSERLNDFASQVMGWALLPFAMSLGIGLFVVVSRMTLLLALVLSLTIVLIALFSWYGLGAIGRSNRDAPSGLKSTMESGSNREKTAPRLSDRIRASLTEARMVLPGAQAMLGFQTIIMLNSDFDKLPNSSQYIHLASLLMTAIATILLMTPAAYHRIAEDGEESESFYRLCSHFVLAAMVPLALGITGDLFVVVRRLTGSLEAGTIIALLMLVVMYGLWFGYTLYRRRSEPAEYPFEAQQS